MHSQPPPLAPSFAPPLTHHNTACPQQCGHGTLCLQVTDRRIPLAITATLACTPPPSQKEHQPPHSDRRINATSTGPIGTFRTLVAHQTFSAFISYHIISYHIISSCHAMTQQGTHILPSGCKQAFDEITAVWSANST